MKLLFIVTYLELNLGRLEFRVDKAFYDNDKAFQYLQEQQGRDPNHINFEVHEIYEPKEE